MCAFDYVWICEFKYTLSCIRTHYAVLVWLVIATVHLRDVYWKDNDDVQINFSFFLCSLSIMFCPPGPALPAALSRTVYLCLNYNHITPSLKFVTTCTRFGSLALTIHTHTHTHTHTRTVSPISLTAQPSGCPGHVTMCVCVDYTWYVDLF